MKNNLQLMVFVLIGAIAVPILVIYMHNQVKRTVDIPCNACHHHNYQYEDEFMHARNKRMQEEQEFFTQQMQHGQTIPPMHVQIYNINVEQEHPLAYPCDPSAPLLEITSARNVTRATAAAVFGEENVITTPLTANVWNQIDRMVNDFIGEIHQVSFAAQRVRLHALTENIPPAHVMVTPRTNNNMTPWVRQFAQPNFEPALPHN